MARCPDHLPFPLCTSKQKGLATNSGNLEKFHVIENKSVSSIWVVRQRKNAGGKNEGIFHYVIENKWRKNARNRPFHYVDENKGSYSRLSIILMKIKGVIENTVTSDKWRVARNHVRGRKRTVTLDPSIWQVARRGHQRSDQHADPCGLRIYL
jgi:hypothetical protein